jgi:hypothetical protein
MFARYPLEYPSRVESESNTQVRDSIWNIDIRWSLEMMDRARERKPRDAK